MVVQVFAVYDSKARVYGQPFFVVNEGLAVRAFQSSCNDPTTELNKYPEDFSLFRLGTFNDENGELRSELPKNLGLAAQYKVKGEA